MIITLTKDEVLSLIALGEEISTATMQDIMNELSIKQQKIDIAFDIK